MPEILTESFCERCGTRYTFESAAPTRAKKLGRFKTISKGLKNYVLSDDSSMDEAMAAARSDQERELTSHQLDAFHSTFNFCMTCRQYTCSNCWNQAEGRCLTCAPHLGHEIMPAPFSDLTPMAGEATHVDASAWPTTDLAPDAPDVLAPPPDLDEILAGRLARISGEEVLEAVAPPAEPAVPAEEPAGAWPMAPEPGLEVAETLESAEATRDADLAEADSFVESVAEADAPPIDAIAEPAVEAVAAVGEAAPVAPVAEADSQAVEPVEASEAQPDAEELPAGVDERAAAASRRTAALLSKFRPGQNIDAELAAYEASVSPEPPVEAPTPEQLPEPVEAAAEPVWVEPEIAAAAPEPEPVAAEAPEQVAAAPEPEPVAAEAPEPVTAAPEPVRADRVEQPTWRIVAPDVPAVPANGHGADQGLPAAASIAPLPPTPSEPEWPVNPQWPVAPPDASLLANRRTSSSAANDALWAASARDVVAQTPSGGVQSCSSCGLSLSATARFCRRCGSRQGA